MSGRIVYFNGEFVPESEARVSIFDSSLMFGDMAFEVARTFGGSRFVWNITWIVSMRLSGCWRSIPA